MNEFDDYSVNMDSECLHQDFDDIDLYGTKTVEDESDGFGDDLELN